MFRRTRRLISDLCARVLQRLCEWLTTWFWRVRSRREHAHAQLQRGAAHPLPAGESLVKCSDCFERIHPNVRSLTKRLWNDSARHKPRHMNALEHIHMSEPANVVSDSHPTTDPNWKNKRGRVKDIDNLKRPETNSPPQRCVCSLCSSDKHPWATAPRQKTSPMPGRSPRLTPSSYSHGRYLERR